MPHSVIPIPSVLPSQPVQAQRDNAPSQKAMDVSDSYTENSSPPTPPITNLFVSTGHALYGQIQKMGGMVRKGEIGKIIPAEKSRVREELGKNIDTYA